ncbi:MAG: hypothetical protein AAF957_10320 [Planctomycetota bacterium]
MRIPTLLALVGPVAVPAAAQSVSLIGVAGQPVPGSGRALRYEKVSVADDGTAFVEVLTSLPSGPGSEFVVLENGVPRFRKGDVLSSPAGVTIEATGNGVEAHLGGRVAGTFWHGPTAPVGFNNGLYIDGTLTILQGELTLASNVDPLAQYTQLIHVEFLSRNQVMLVARLEDPTRFHPNHYSAMLFEVSDTGALVSERSLVRGGDLLPGQTQNVLRLGITSPESSINSSGSLIFGAHLFGPDAFSKVVYLDQTLLLQEGSPSIVPGRDWGENEFIYVDLNEAGDWVMNAAVEDVGLSDHQVIVRSGELFVRQGEVLPGTAPQALTSLGSEVWITDTGDVIWSGEWSGPSGEFVQGLFFNRELVMETGVTRFGSATLSRIYPGFERASVSPDGSRMLMTGVVQRGTEARSAAFEIVFDVGSNYCANPANSTGSPGTLRIDGTADVAANDLTLVARDLPANVTGYFITSRTAGLVANTGTIIGNTCVAGQIGRFIGPGQVLSSGSAGLFSLDVDLQAMPTPNGFVAAMAGETWYFQGWHRDAFGGQPVSVFTDASSVTMR